MMRVLNCCPEFMWYAVDPWSGEYQGSHRVWGNDRQRRHEAVFERRLGGHPNITKMKMTSQEASELIGHVDLVFIDGSHDYDNCKQDIELWQGKCDWLLGHDYHHKRFPGVTEAVDELLEVDMLGDYVWMRKNEG